MSPRSVVIDTNFLLLPFQFHIDILREMRYLMDFSHRYVISSRTIRELKKVGRRTGKNGMAARLALKLIEANKASIDIVESDEMVDDWIVDYARKHRAIVCTNDSELRQRLRALRVKTVTMKAKSKLGFV